MTRDEMIETAKTEMRQEPGYSFDDRALASAIAAGLVDGDRIALGGGLVAHVAGDRVSMIKGGSECAEMAISDLTPQQHDRMLILKGMRAAQRGVSTGCM